MNKKNLLLNIERGKRLREARACLNISQGALGKKLDMTYADIKNRESGKVKIQQNFAAALEKEWGISSGWLLTGQGTMKTASIVKPTGMEPYDMLLKALMDRIDAQGKSLKEMQETISDLNLKLTDITAALGQEIGEIKNKMIDAARTGNIHHLDPDRPPHFRN